MRQFINLVEGLVQNREKAQVDFDLSQGGSKGSMRYLLAADHPDPEQIGESAVVRASPGFEAWFAGSKVVDGGGRPLIVYHGTAKGFDEFHTPAFFAADPAEASSYAKDRGRSGGGHVRPVYLRITRPANAHDIEETLSELGIDPLSVPSLAAFGDDPQVVAALRQKGFDGIMGVNDFGMDDDFREFPVMVAFERGQIRSASTQR